MPDLPDIFRPDLSDADFSRHALALLRRQAVANPVYRRYLAALNFRPETCDRWQDFPALPASAFREQPVCCFPPEQAVAVFETSGTTGAKTGRHYFADLRPYEASLLAGFRMFMPDLTRHRWLSLIPSPTIKPHSSLSHMIGCLSRGVSPLQLTNPHNNTTQNASLVSCNGLTPPPCQFYCDADYRPDLAAFARDLNQAAADRASVAIFATSFALADACENIPPVQLPAGSVVFDTGGYKGRRRELTAEELTALINHTLAIPAARQFNEYGMTELSTPGYARRDEGLCRFPPWLKVLLRHPATGAICPPGERGLMHLYDLANIDSVMAIATLDTAIYEGDGIRLTGRVTAADPRGCSLPYES